MYDKFIKILLNGIFIAIKKFKPGNFLKSLNYFRGICCEATVFAQPVVNISVIYAK